MLFCRQSITIINLQYLIMWHDFLNPHEQAEYECSECGAAMETDKGVCSGTCHEASMI